MRPNVVVVEQVAEVLGLGSGGQSVRERQRQARKDLSSEQQEATYLVSFALERHRFGPLDEGRDALIPEQAGRGRSRASVSGYTQQLSPSQTHRASSIFGTTCLPSEVAAVPSSPSSPTPRAVPISASSAASSRSTPSKRASASVRLLVEGPALGAPSLPIAVPRPCSAISARPFACCLDAA